MHIYKEEDFEDIREIEKEVSQLVGAFSAIESFGINPTAVSILKTSGLLSEASKNAIALESMGFHTSQEPESQMALESLLDTIKEKMASWSSKILSMIKDTGSKLMKTISGLWDRLKELTKTVKEKAFDKIEKSKNIVKAHPARTIAAVATAALTVVTILTFTARGLPTPSKAKELPEFLTKVSEKINKIQWPFGKIASKISNNKRLTVSIVGATGAVTAATIAKLGWTKSIIDTTSNMFDKVGNQIRSVWPDVQEKSINATRDIWTITKGMVVGGVEGARTGWNVTGSIDTPGSTEGQILNTGVKASGAVIGATFTMFSVGVASLFYTLFKLLQIVVVGGFRLICSTYNHLLQSTPLSQRYI